MKLYSILSVVFLFSQSARAAPMETMIIHGTTVSSQDWISHTVVALISKNHAGEALCTASLVAPDLAITAAHCVTSEDLSPSLLQLVFAKDIHSARADQIRVIDRVEIPAEWNPAHSPEKDTSDVALIHIVGELPTGYSPSDLLPFDHEFASGEKAILAGYGISNASANSGAGVLRKTEVNVLNPNYSEAEIEFDQSKGGGACHGDSGGPAYLMINQHPYLFGITSRGAGNCDIDVIYTKISAYQDWFTEAVTRIRK